MAVSKGIKQFLDRCKKIHGSRYDYSKVEYTGCFNKVTIVCQKHGDFLQEPNAHIGKQQQGCWDCGQDKLKERMALFSEVAGKEFVSKANLVHNYRFTYENAIYTRSSKPLEITCGLHGNFKQTPNAHLAGKGCRKCNLGGFNADNPAKLYLLRCEDYFKIGITNRPIIARLNDIQRASGKSFQVIGEWNFTTGDKAFLIEKGLLNDFHYLFENIADKFNGCTECFVLESSVQAVKIYIESVIKNIAGIAER